MIFNTFADSISPVSIGTRIRIVFLFFALVSFAAALLTFSYPSLATDWNWVYKILFPLSVVTCLSMAVHPTIGDGSLYLLPLFLASAIRVVDLWQNYFLGQITLEVATRGAIGWSFLLIGVAYVDLLESRIYHRMVNYIEQRAD